ncbi:MAG: HD domain-containing protein [Elusimicrobiota bacterium]|jgi:putative hydrolase of HD superfamily|nr:HD domain-containing protein [Elusimicrobiota bacterium]
MITKKLIMRIFSAANILRWNDHIRPFDFFELDKQAHKMIIAYIVAKFEEEDGKKIDWNKLIEGGIFEFFHRIMLTDLKPEVFHELMSKKKKEINAWILDILDAEISNLGGGFKEKLSTYFCDDNYAAHEKRILAAAHCMSTKWEFGIIYPWNAMIYGIEKTKQDIDESLATYDDLSGIRKLIINKKYYGFLDLCGQLRFQQRWAQAYRIPKTTVLGHMLIVAIFVYIFSAQMKVSDTRLYNNFFCALFHDLPEILTKDIISPVKSSVEGLGDIIKLYEEKQVDERILPLIPNEWHKEMIYFIKNEFSDKIIEGSTVKEVPDACSYNDDKYNAVDGSLVNICDKLSAYIEVSLALEYGIKSETLINSQKAIYDAYFNSKKGDIDFKQIFDYFM